MEHIQHLSMTWLRNPAARIGAPAGGFGARCFRTANACASWRSSITEQLVQAKQRTGSHYETLRVQTDALRQFTLELTPFRPTRS